LLRRGIYLISRYEKHEFRDKVVVITVASAGIGMATAWFAKQGAKLVLLETNRSLVRRLSLI
jgi:NADP-dependent 3-hydroxy acid dehydrogenase YdfG